MQLSVFGLDHPRGYLGPLMAEALANQGHTVVQVADITDVTANSSLSILCIDAAVTREQLAAQCEAIGLALRLKDRFHALAVRGPLPAGAVHAVLIPALERASGKRAGADFGLAVYPHFLERGSVVEDYFNPPAIIVGVTDDETLARLREMDIALEAPEIVVGLAEAEALSRIDVRALAEQLSAEEPVSLSGFALEAACAS